MSTTFWIIVAGAVVTYLTRIGGHLVLSRFERVHPRVEAALDAVPAAVLTTLVAPALIHAGPAELAALAVAGHLALHPDQEDAVGAHEGQDAHQDQNKAHQGVGEA